MDYYFKMTDIKEWLFYTQFEEDAFKNINFVSVPLENDDKTTLKMQTSWTIKYNNEFLLACLWRELFCL